MHFPVLCDDLPGDCCPDCHDEELNASRPFEVLERLVYNPDGPPRRRVVHAAYYEGVEDRLGYSCCLKVLHVVEAVVAAQ